MISKVILWICAKYIYIAMQILAVPVIAASVRQKLCSGSSGEPRRLALRALPLPPDHPLQPAHIPGLRSLHICQFNHIQSLSIVHHTILCASLSMSGFCYKYEIYYEVSHLRYHQFHSLHHTRYLMGSLYA